MTFAASEVASYDDASVVPCSTNVMRPGGQLAQSGLDILKTLYTDRLKIIAQCGFNGPFPPCGHSQLLRDALVRRKSAAVQPLPGTRRIEAQRCLLHRLQGDQFTADLFARRAGPLQVLLGRELILSQALYALNGGRLRAAEFLITGASARLLRLKFRKLRARILGGHLLLFDAQTLAAKREPCAADPPAARYACAPPVSSDSPSRATP